MWHTAFALSDVAYEGVKVGAAPTTGGYGAGSARGDLRATFALKGDVLWMPLVGLAERDFAALVVRLDALDDLHHGLLPLSPAVCLAGRVGNAKKLTQANRDCVIDVGKIECLAAQTCEPDLDPRLRLRLASPSSVVSYDHERNGRAAGSAPRCSVAWRATPWL
jgi:hypothetical protein